MPLVPGAPPAPAQRRTNRFAIFALVTGLAGIVVLAIAFAVVALVQTGRRGERGVRLAIGGLAASAVWVLAVVALIAVLQDVQPGQGSRADVRRDGTAPLTELGIGDCFTGFGDDGSGGFLGKKAPCTQPHEGEVVARTETPPVQQTHGAMTAWAKNLCQNKTRYLLRSRYRKDLEPYYNWSGDEHSDAKDLTLTCVMRYTGSKPLTAPLAATVDANLKTYEQLTAGECVADWDDADPVTATMSCKKPHRFQVYATFTIPSEEFPAKEFNEYPGKKEIDKRAARGCTKRGNKALRNRPIERDLELMYVMPSQEDWEGGIHDVACLVQAAHGKLNKSLLP